MSCNCSNKKIFEQSKLFSNENVKDINIESNIEFNKNKYCPYVFSNSKIPSLEVNDLMITFFKINKFNFLSIQANITRFINSNITQVSFDVYLYDINNELLDENVYSKTIFITITGTVLNIDKNSFFKLENLKKIYLRLYYLKNTFYKGNNWLEMLNPNIKSDSAYNLEMNIKNKTNVLFLCIEDQENFFTDENLCLFKNFPHFRAVYLVYHNGNNNCSCICQWLLKYSYIYMKYFSFTRTNDSDYYMNYFSTYDINMSIPLLLSYNISNIQGCNLDENFEKCQSFKSVQKKNYDTSWDDLIGTYLFISQLILLPLLSFIGLIFNMFTLLMLRYGFKQKKLQKNFFRYFYYSTIFNFLLCLLSMLKLINICIDFGSFYCPKYSLYIVSQYFDIIFFKYVFSVVKLSCAILELMISFNRYRGVNRKETSEVSSYFLIIIVAISAFINSIKIFEYSINEDFKQTANIPLNKYLEIFCISGLYEDSGCDRIKILSLIYSISIGPLFALLTFIIDFKLLLQVKIINSKKLKLIIKENSKNKENQLKERCIQNENRIKKMIIANSLIMAFLRFPEIISYFFIENNRNSISCDLVGCSLFLKVLI